MASLFGPAYSPEKRAPNGTICVSHYVIGIYVAQRAAVELNCTYKAYKGF